MANWAKLQEDLVGLPVAKRARHGIHFQKSANEFVANFSGKPCHYLDAGLWKPIDTKLLVTSGGFYGSPHSDVKIHPDGRVVVDKSDYQQFTKLPSAKAGKLAGDRIIREFPGGEQHLIMTEDGFKEEIHVFKPTFPLEKFIAKTTGNLPSKYKAHPITAEDADGNTYTFTGDVKAFGAWLDKAVYPVVIDPDFSAESGGDTLSGNNSVPNRNFGNSTGYYHNFPHLYRFILSSIPSPSICSACSFTITISASGSGTQSTLSFYKISDANGDWIEGNGSDPAASGMPNWKAKFADGAGGITTAWAGSDGCNTIGTDYESTVLGSFAWTHTDAAGTPYTAIFNAAGIAVIQSWFGEATNNGILNKITSGYAFQSPTTAFSEHATAAYRPVLTVTYTVPSTAFVNILDHTNSVILGGSIVR